MYVSFEQQQVAAKDELAPEETTGVVPPIRGKRGILSRCSRHGFLERERRNAANVLAISAYGACILYCVFAVGGADSRPFRTRKYPRAGEGAKRERDLHGMYVCVCGG